MSKAGQVLHGNKLTPKQELFCQTLVKTGDLKKTSQTAYPKQIQPLVQGIENLSKPNVVNRIQEIKAQALDLLQANADTSLPTLIKHTASHLKATKDVIYNAQGDSKTQEDTEGQHKAQALLYRLYGLMDRYQLDQPQATLTIQVDVNKLAKCMSELSQLNESLGFKTLDI